MKSKHQSILHNYTLPGYMSNYKALYNPILHQVWIRLERDKRKTSRTIVEEATHAAWVSGTPSQFYPLLNALSGKEEFPNIDLFRDLVEGLFVSYYPIMKNRSIDCRNLPKTDKLYREIATKIIHIAIDYAKSADLSITKVQAKKAALHAIITFLYNIVPLESSQGLNIVDYISKIKPQDTWNTSNQIFLYLISEYNMLNHKKTTNTPPFYVKCCSGESHFNIHSLVCILEKLLKSCKERIIPAIPAVLEYMTFGLATFLPIITFSEVEKKTVVGIQIWNETEKTLRPKKIKECLNRFNNNEGNGLCESQSLEQWWLNAIVKSSKDYDTEGGRLELFKDLVGELPEFIENLNIVMKNKDRLCPKCNDYLNSKDMIKSFNTCYKNINKNINKLSEAAKEYPKWLTNDCIGLIINQEWLQIRYPIYLFDIKPQLHLFYMDNHK